MSADDLKQEILKRVAEYFRLVHRQDQPFVPGKSRIGYAGRVFDESEVLNLVDASLEFWLTHGRFSKLFEKKFSDFLGVRFCSLVNSGSSANLLAFMALTSDELGERKIERGHEVITVSDGLVNLSDCGKRPAGVATEFNLVGAQLDEAPIGVGRVSVIPAIAEYPSRNAEHWGIATGPRQRAANAFDRCLALALVEQRLRQTTIQVGVRVSVAVFAPEIGKARVQRPGGKRRQKSVGINRCFGEPLGSAQF